MKFIESIIRNSVSRFAVLNRVELSSSTEGKTIFGCSYPNNGKKCIDHQSIEELSVIEDAYIIENVSAEINLDNRNRHFVKVDPDFILIQCKRCKSIVAAIKNSEQLRNIYQDNSKYDLLFISKAEHEKSSCCQISCCTCNGTITTNVETDTQVQTENSTLEADKAYVTSKEVLGKVCYLLMHGKPISKKELTELGSALQHVATTFVSTPRDKDWNQVVNLSEQKLSIKLNQITGVKINISHTYSEMDLLQLTNALIICYDQNL